MWLKIGKDKKLNDEQIPVEYKSPIMLQIQLMEVKLEGMISDIKHSLDSDYKVLKQRMDSIQTELTEFKKEVKGLKSWDFMF